MTVRVIFITVTVLLAWSYILWPAGVMMAAWLRRNSITPENRFKRRVTASGEGGGRAEAALPSLSVVMAVHNEERVIRKKIESVLSSDYPPHLMEIVIGSDASNDGTDEAIAEMAAGNGRIRLIRGGTRQGKPAMINRLVAEADGEIIIVTDANVIFTPLTVKRLAEPFVNNRVGLCDATPLTQRVNNRGVGRQENLYSRMETALKRAEGELWGAMPGPYGGCYAIRRSIFPVLPENILVDDLYAGLTVLKKSYRSLNIPEAIVSEDTQPDMRQQYKRRVRIATGSYQNLFHFGLLPSKRAGVIITLISHKVLRWLSPLLILIFIMTTIILSSGSNLYLCLLSALLIFLILSAFDLLLDRKGKQIIFQRYLTHFLLMNLALATGFVKAVRGVESGIWEPTKRVCDERGYKA